ncbi:MAG: ribosome maturation factor RimM [Bacteroidales bacterium]|nr:ribosome maturation factor RimM [Bacteroidales bacterium]
MVKQGYFQFGKVNKTHGVKGELAIIIDVDDPYAFEHIHMFFIEINRSLIPYFIESIRVGGKKAIVALQDINSVEKANWLCGRSIYLPESLLPALEEDEFYSNELIGFDVTDIHFGYLGKVDQIIELPMHNLIQILKDDQEILIPMNEEIVTEINKTAKTIQIDAPTGLIELYLKT